MRKLVLILCAGLVAGVGFGQEYGVFLFSRASPGGEEYAIQLAEAVVDELSLHENVAYVRVADLPTVRGFGDWNLRPMPPFALQTALVDTGAGVTCFAVVAAGIGQQAQQGKLLYTFPLTHWVTAQYSEIGSYCARGIAEWVTEFAVPWLSEEFGILYQTGE